MQTLTPEQIAALDMQIVQTESYKEHKVEIEQLKANDEAVMDKLGSLEKGQGLLEKGQEDIEERLDKGGERMDGIEKMIRDGDKRRDEQHADVINKIDAKEMGELKAEIRKRNEKDEKDEAKKWDLAKIFLASAITAVVAYVVFLLKGP